MLYTPPAPVCHIIQGGGGGHIQETCRIPNFSKPKTAVKKISNYVKAAGQFVTGICNPSFFVDLGGTTDG